MSPISSMVLFGVMDVDSHGHNFLSYLFGFTAMLFTANSYGKMVEAFPIAGSTYSYTQRAISPKLGFMAGWVILLDYFLIPTLLYVISANCPACRGRGCRRSSVPWTSLRERSSRGSAAGDRSCGVDPDVADPDGIVAVESAGQT